ncbi:MAG: HEAT repeat domain-containing protein [Bacteroidetes bacterium]|nr:HEAT repeat domain-containing protein [Bacteroidota bacterium]
MKFYSLLLSAVALVLLSCNPSKRTAKSDKAQVINLDTLTIHPKDNTPVYHESEAHEMDILDTKLELKPDWENGLLYGKATLTLKPYFYPQNQVKLNAQSFELTDVFILRNGLKSKAEYNYDTKIISINLNKSITRKDTLQLYIEYVAKANNLELKGRREATSDKGLFFINADGSDPNKPKQIFTQSETQSASCWFPTIDAPNQRMTQQIAITVDKKYTTLSNGLLLNQIDNNDGTRTDTWKQSLAAAPYLSMFAIGEFSVTKDKWRNKEVSYYVEKNYGKEAQGTFGNTPEMIEFYSKKLGVDFPWEKYAQVVVRDYPGGSMENTSATLHGEFMNITARERLDNEKEEYISHELFHQWFGDLVTCESWSNTALNESFATYGEYLWFEYHNGREDADIHHQDDLNSYFNEARAKQVKMIRFDYEDTDDMFDRHSYEKGGRILHMLRNYVGDDAFFTALNLYLTEHRFSTVEIHELRLTFEKVCGQDLNWFFNQWFFASGHPELFITYEYNEATKKEIVHIEQVQDLSKTPLYRLPMAIDIYSFGKKERHNITLKKETEEFVFDVAAKPNLVNVDAEKMLLCKKNDTKTQEEWAFQYRNAPLYLDRYEALDAISKNPTAKSKEIIIKALSDKNWSIRNFAIKKLDSHGNNGDSEIRPILIKLALKDEKPSVRANAIEMLGKLFNEEDLLDVYKNASDDKSYTVAAQALSTLYEKNPEQGFEEAKRFENDSNYTILSALLTIFSSSGSDIENSFFISRERFFNSYGRYSFTQLYGKYLLGRSDSIINAGLPLLESTARTSNIWWVRLVALQAIDSLQSMYEARENELKAKKAAELNAQALESAHAQYQKLKALFESVKGQETDKNLLRYYSN